MGTPALTGKSCPLPRFLSSLFTSSANFHPHDGVSRDERIRIIPAYPCTVFFNISGMSPFICSVPCYSRNARFAVSRRLQAAPGETRESRRSPCKPPPPSPLPTLHTHTRAHTNAVQNNHLSNLYFSPQHRGENSLSKNWTKFLHSRVQTEENGGVFLPKKNAGSYQLHLDFFLLIKTFYGYGNNL